MGDSQYEGQDLDPEEQDLTATRVLSAPRTGMAAQWPLRAEVIGGAMDGTRTSAQKSTLTLGRGGDNDLVLTLDPAVSTHHARILREGERYWLEDLESRNGTFLGSQSVKGRVPIGPGTMFTVGRTRLEFLAR